MLNYLISAVSAISSPTTMAAAISRCTLNGRPVDCGGFEGIIISIFGGIWFVWFALVILMVVSNWKIYVKAGKPGWVSIVPVYNIVVLLDIVGKPLWWVILMFIPFVNIIISIIILHRLSLSFGKDAGFTVGLFFLSFIFFPILGLGNSRYQKLNMEVQ